MNSHLLSHLNWVDFAIIGIILFSIIISFFRGFVREAVSLVVWVAGIIVAIKFVEPVQIYLQTWIVSSSIRYAVAFISLFLSVFIIGIILNMLIHVLLKKTGLSITDRLLGIFFGAGRGFLIVAVLLLFVSIGSVEDGSLIAQSQLAPKFQPIVSWLNQFLPSQFKQFSHWLADQPVSKVNNGDR
ncbi:CvpA family protein [Coxiella burnetii]|uniref:CvpA family protein n=1 Tax=Coxiella burnetii TaxID=777 RepID=UPI0000ECFF8D|nr:CvpA family protein [Coxiella burnetii]ACJ20016.1 colicin V production protein [Coxiella burnetii CbuK_Q154]AIT63038.1 Colicin V production protein [Coxiella burnetii str. Namibia]ATN85465.1 colicin V synthesis protein [Coxiella burnetii str. Schperling]EAX33750.1 colicin V synthesis protein [Coxiella burnetii 'MSU Goat Q177']EDR36386.1 colicin V production protein [Coxiella burnetii Q321]